MADVLVTGATGFVGFHLVKALVERGDRVTCLVRKSSKRDLIAPLGPAYAYGDVTDAASLREPFRGKDVIYHVAGCIRALGRRQLYRVNEEGCRNVAEACAALAPPPVLVQVSSLAAAGPSSGRPRIESDVPLPVSQYGQSKRAGELAAEALADRVPITVVRPAIVVGEGDPITLAMFQGIQWTATHWVVGVRPHRFSVIHAADLAQLLILAAERGKRLVPATAQGNEEPAAGYYFAATEDCPTYGELGQWMAAAMGRRALVIPMPLPLAWFFALLSEGAAQLVRRPWMYRLDKYREARAGDWLCSSDRAARELGFAPGASLADRLRQTVAWYREHRWL